MIRLFQFVVLVLGLSLVALASAIITMRFAIHGAEVTLPSFKGLTADEALTKAADLGVEMTIDNRFYSAEVPAGRILTQMPAPGTTVRLEWHVRATESLGPQRVVVPDLTGQPQRAATMQLRRLGLELGTVARMPYAAAKPETVIAQDPPARATGVERPSISMIVSDPVPESSAKFVMPDLVGRQYATAVATINGAGLKLTPVVNQVSTTNLVSLSPSLPGTVLTQKPEAGYCIDASTPIELTVAR